MNTSSLDYTDIRRLRGKRTRAAFAADLGVDPHTVYRWELEPGAPQARRPRGKVLARLYELANRAERATTTTADVPNISSAALPATLVTVSGNDRDAMPIGAALLRMLDGDWRDAESALLRAASDRNSTPAVQVLASTGLAAIEVLFRADGRRALAVLAPAMAPGAPPLALAEAIAALAYSFPDGELFDVGRVHAHAARAELLARGESPVTEAFAITAESNAALMAGDDDLQLRALARVEHLAVASLPEVAALFVDQLRALAASRTGQIRAASERIERMLADPRLGIVPPIEVRTCAMRAIRSLDELGDPSAALALARRARGIIEGARLPVGVHTGVVLRAEAEALMRLGRLDDADAVFAEADRILVDNRFPVTIVFPSQLRFLLVRGRAEALERQAERLAAIELPSIRPLCQAYAAWFAATATVARGDAGELVMAAFTHAEQACARWAPVRRDFLVSFASSAVGVSSPAEARPVFERAQRAANLWPTAWMSAHLRRIEGCLLVAEGRLDEGRMTFDAASAAFAASGDLLDATLARFGMASMLVERGEPGAVTRVAELEAELAAMHAPKPQWIIRTGAHINRSLSQAPAVVAHGPDGPRLAPGIEVAVQRLAIAGATTEIIRRELIAVAQEFVTGPVVLVAPEDGAPPEVAAWFDVGGGSRRLRLGVTRMPSEAERASLRLVALVAGLAFEAAELRSGESLAATTAEVSDIPGLVAASPAMRRVIADVGRLADSRATIVIAGESGVGKELIARALHQRSSRADRPYIAFNCASIPHELFEGQLFGYRKGAFTGATADQPGVIRAADGGTLFLDEIGELPIDVQPKLLRFLDNAEVFPLGAQRAVIVDVRVIAATNRDLAAEVRRGRFREDLYYRLLVVPLVVPPLRARREDIVPLARFFVRSLTEHGRPPAFAPDALAALEAHPWPGNVRELRNVIARALAYSPRPDVITRAELGL
jgi:predicted ATP-dependent protease